MDIDEAIRHAEEVAERNWEMVSCYHTDEGVYMHEEAQCRECAEEHQQLAEWLKELKALRNEKPQWIRDKDRHPDKEGAYLVTGERYYIPDHVDEKDHIRVRDVLYYHPKWGWGSRDGIEKVFAWMPLPEMYKGR